MIQTKKTAREARDFLASYVGASALIRLHREDLGVPLSDGYVLGMSTELVLLQPIRDRIDLDGYDVLRIADITKLSATPRPKATFYKEALAIKRQVPKLPKKILLNNMRSLLQSVNDNYPLIVIHRELMAPDSCEIGQISKIGSMRYRLHWINPMAVFEPDRRSYNLVDVTRVQFDGAYENTLATVAKRREDRDIAKSRG